MKNILNVHTVHFRYGIYRKGSMTIRKYEYNGKECYSVVISGGKCYFYWGKYAREKTVALFLNKKESVYGLYVTRTKDTILGDIHNYIESLDVNKCKEKINMLKFLAK